MTVPKLIERGQEVSVADSVDQTLDECGYTIEESIPGLVREIILLARKTPFPDDVIEDAIDLLDARTLDEEEPV